MPYRYLEDVATADVAFEAWGKTVEDMFAAACDATLNVMLEDLDTISGMERRPIHVKADEMDMLLFETLQELIFYKDSERLLLRVREVDIQRRDGHFTLSAEAYGDPIELHERGLLVDVKAVTLHRFHLEETQSGWKCTVILDI